MADASLKEQKLSAARKKLRDYQKKKADGQTAISKSRESPLEILNGKRESISSSSSVTDISICSKKSDESNNFTLDEFNSPVAQESLPVIVNTINNSVESSEPSSLTSSNQVPSESLNEIPDPDYDNSARSQQPLQDESPSNPSSSVKEIIEENTISQPENYVNLVDKYDSPETEGSVCSETNASMTTVIPLKGNNGNTENGQVSNELSTEEALRKLSFQIRSLMNDDEDHDPNRDDVPEEMVELERRNNELAALLEEEKKKSIGSSLIFQEMERKLEEAKAQVAEFGKISVTDSNGTEVHGLREQLQVHIQTIGILVAEKSELQTNLSHTRYNVDKQAGELIELHGRLDASRERINALEASNQDLKSQVSNLMSSKETDSQQLNSLQGNYAKLSKVCDEMRASTAEITERLAVRTEENEKLNGELTDVKRLYELAQVHVNQLRDSSTEDLKKQFDNMQKLYDESLSQLACSKTAVEQSEREKQQLELEYKSYTSQLAIELDDWRRKFVNESKKCEAMEVAIKELETVLKSKDSEATLALSLECLQIEKNQLENEIKESIDCRQQLEEKCSALIRDNGQLTQILSEQRGKLESLEAAADRSNTQEVDTGQLLQVMQSDKIAAARALSQNKQLKEQLEELQNGFIMMSNKKLELTEKLEKELHIKKGLYNEIYQLGEDLNSHKEKLLAKQREIDELKNGRALSDPQKSQVSQMDTTQNNLMNGHHHHHHHHHRCNEHPNDEGEDFISENDTKPSKQNIIESENQNSDVISTRLDPNQEQSDSANSETGLQEAQKNLPEQFSDGGKMGQVSLKIAHEALEKKFTKCMQDLAAVSDEKQTLEHLVQQLQLETETVGDYITIYQFQRGVMKQQMLELRHELDLLRTEKKQMFSKSMKLQELIGNLASDAEFSKGFRLEINDLMKAGNDKVSVDDELTKMETGSPTPVIHPLPKNLMEESNVKSKDSRLSQTETVKQIVELLGEMEIANQFDVSAFTKLHPCSHCSGELKTI